MLGNCLVFPMTFCGNFNQVQGFNARTSFWRNLSPLREYGDAMANRNGIFVKRRCYDGVQRTARPTTPQPNPNPSEGRGDRLVGDAGGLVRSGGTMRAEAARTGVTRPTMAMLAAIRFRWGRRRGGPSGVWQGWSAGSNCVRPSWDAQLLRRFPSRFPAVAR